MRAQIARHVPFRAMPRRALLNEEGSEAGWEVPARTKCLLMRSEAHVQASYVVTPSWQER